MKTIVEFRKYNDGQIIALFPTLPWNDLGHITSYMHIGQHGGCLYFHVIKSTVSATKTEYQDLYNELTKIGYDLQVSQRKTPMHELFKTIGETLNTKI